MLSTITVNGVSVTCVAMPSTPGLRDISWNFTDAVAENVSPFTGQSQSLQWFGADRVDGVANLPPLTAAQLVQWKGFLMQLRGVSNAFLMGDPLYSGPSGNLQGSVPLVTTTSGTNLAGAQSIVTRGWAASQYGLLLRGDYLQIGYRLHMALDDVASDSSGSATIPIWPSLREQPADATALILANPQGLFKRADNKGTWSSDYTLLSRLSFPFKEYR